jgi:hypothetical protein
VVEADNNQFFFFLQRINDSIVDGGVDADDVDGVLC